MQVLFVFFLIPRIHVCIPTSYDGVVFKFRYMQSFQEILEFSDKNADDEKVTYE